MKRTTIFFLIFLFPFFSSAQQSKIDSLLTYLKKAPDDTVKVNTLNALSREQRAISNYGQSLYYAQQAEELAEKIQLPGEKSLGWLKGIGNSLNSIGLVYWGKGEYNQAFDYFSRTLAIREKIGDKISIGDSYNNLGLIYASQGNNEKAVESHMKSLKVMEQYGNKRGMGNSYVNLGLIYNDLGNYELALKYFFKALKIQEELNNKLLITACYNNIGLTYENQGSATSNKTMANDKYQKALDSHFKSLKFKEELGDKQGISASYNNIGIIYSDMEKIAPSKKVAEKYSEEALGNYLKALVIAKEIGVKNLICNASINIANVYIRENKLDEAYDYLNEALKISREIGRKDILMDGYLALSNLFEKKQDYKQAVEYYTRYNNLKDTLINETSGKRIAEMNVKYDSEKKDKELILKDAEITKKQAESDKEQTQRNAFIIGFGLVLLLALFILRGYRQKKAANELLETKNEAIHKQNIEIENKNTVITDSIEYAKNIQQAILPSEEEIRKHFAEHFIMYQPKDIVSGDFYWLQEQGEYVLLAVADCTGHGVPGAFMSLMGYNLLNDVVNTAGNTSLSKILEALNSKVMETLKQGSKNTSAKYGMDIGLVSYSKKTKAIEFAGAHNPLYIFRNKECIQLKADKRSIGSISTQAFKEQSFQLEKGDMLYLFSDGYVDQLGGKENTKFFAQPFRDLLQEICEMDMSTQKQRLERAHSDWKGNKKQTDDILVVGIRV